MLISCSFLEGEFKKGKWIMVSAWEMRKTPIITAKHWQIIFVKHTGYETQGYFKPPFLAIFPKYFQFFSLTLNHLSLFNRHWFFYINLAEAHGCINHSVINKDIVKVQVKHRRQEDMNTPFDWPQAWCQWTFQLARRHNPMPGALSLPWHQQWLFPL